MNSATERGGVCVYAIHSRPLGNDRRRTQLVKYSVRVYTTRYPASLAPEGPPSDDDARLNPCSVPTCFPPADLSPYTALALIIKHGRTALAFVFIRASAPFHTLTSRRTPPTPLATTPFTVWANLRAPLVARSQDFYDANVLGDWTSLGLARQAHHSSASPLTDCASCAPSAPLGDIMRSPCSEHAPRRAPAHHLRRPCAVIVGSDARAAWDGTLQRDMGTLPFMETSLRRQRGARARGEGALPERVQRRRRDGRGRA